MSMNASAEGAAPVEPGEAFSAGRVAIVGRPNVGKSTLLNALVGESVSITSRKAQTTRDAVLGVRTDATSQIVFVDTPGYQRTHRSLLTRRMNDRVVSTLHDVDVVLLVIDARGWSPLDEPVLALLPPVRPDGPPLPPSVLVLNKSDEVESRDTLLPMLAQSAQRYPFAALVPVSAERGHQLDDLVRAIRPMLPDSVPLFDADQYTDRSLRFLAAERVREKAFRLLGDEIPYGIAVAIELWEENDKHCAIAAAILVERDAHRGIVIGAGGAKLREIGRLARQDLIGMMGKTVRLDLHVKVRRNWSDDARALASLGYG
jgi:GTP-binding protein Era